MRNRHSGVGLRSSNCLAIEMPVLRPLAGLFGFRKRTIARQIGLAIHVESDEARMAPDVTERDEIYAVAADAV